MLTNASVLFGSSQRLRSKCLKWHTRPSKHLTQLNFLIPEVPYLPYSSSTNHAGLFICLFFLHLKQFAWNALHAPLHSLGNLSSFFEVCLSSPLAWEAFSMSLPHATWMFFYTDCRALQRPVAGPSLLPGLQGAAGAERLITLVSSTQLRAWPCGCSICV